MILYADVLFAINFSMDFLTIFICSLIMHKKVHRLRTISASLIGGVYGVTEIILDVHPVLSIIICISVAVIMCLIAFKAVRVKEVISLSLMYVFISATLGGIMSVLYSFFNRILADYISKNTYEGAYSNARLFIIIGLTAIASIIFSRILTSKKEIEAVKLRVKIKDKHFTLNGLCDSGNLLTEPFSGRRVILVSEKSEIGKIIKSADLIKKKYIPYKDINGEGMISGIVPTEIAINDSLTDAVIATVENKNFNGYDALVPRALL